MHATLEKVFGYQGNNLNLPVKDVSESLPFYTKIFGFREVSRNDSPHRSVLLARNQVRLGLAENGGDPSQEGCFFEVDDVESALAEIKLTKLNVSEPDMQSINGQTFKAFFVVAPDGLCFMIAQPQPE